MHDSVKEEIYGMYIIMQPKVATLANGLQIVVCEMPQSPLVAASWFVRGGARGEHNDEVGIAHFMEHMLFHGTPKFPSEDVISDLVEQPGGESNAFTSYERIGCYIYSFKEQLPIIADILADVAFRPCLPEAKIETERGTIIQEIAKYHDDPDEFALRLYNKSIWGEHPIGRDILGTKEDVLRYQRDHLLAYHERFFAPDNMVVSVAGGITFEEVCKTMEQHFGHYPARAIIVPANPILVSPQNMVVFVERSIEQAICILGRTPVDWISYCKGNVKDRMALVLLMNILGHGMSSRLFRTVRTEHGLVYTIIAQASILEDYSYVSIYFGADPGNVAKALEIIFAELDRLLAEGVTEQELVKAKNIFRKAHAKILEDSLHSALNIGQLKSMGIDDLDLEKNFRDHIEPITCDDILVIAKQIFDERYFHFVGVGALAPHQSSIEKILLG